MLRRHALSLVSATAALVAPAGTAIADDGGSSPATTPATIDVNLPGPHDTVRAKLNAAVRPPLVDDVVALARTRARLKDAHLRRGYRHELSTWTPPRLRAERRDLRHQVDRLRAELRRQRLAARRAAAAAASASAPAPAGTGTTTPGSLGAIAACESGGNPAAVDATGTYRGKYQFDMQTWRSVGGTGDPAAASEAEQDKRAALLYARSGSSPWPVCG
jgi:Transglycosylase-like domain